jgi:hypothetical protein
MPWDSTIGCAPGIRLSRLAMLLQAISHNIAHTILESHGIDFINSHLMSKYIYYIHTQKNEAFQIKDI